MVFRIIGNIGIALATIFTVGVMWFGAAQAETIDTHTYRFVDGKVVHVSSYTEYSNKTDKNGNVEHTFKNKTEVLYTVKGRGVNIGENNLNSAFGPKFHPVTGTRRPICRSTDFYSNEKGLLTCDAIKEWAING